ncbi:MAG: IclR family transcriptional regulator [Mesorhizobium amorphae]|nr:MAG: IclR family transcriptional regulator [Mesorhizobium amorphae]
MRKRVAATLASNSGEGVNSAASLARGLQLLRAFSRADATLGNQELIQRTGLPKATVSRLTAMLVGLGYLDYDATLGRYSIGAATVSLGYSALSSNSVIHVARPLMQELADETGAAVAIGMRDGLEMVYLANCRSPGPVSLQLDVGSRVPIDRTAMGLAWLASATAPEREALFARWNEEFKEKAKALAPLAEAARRETDGNGFVGAFGTWYSYINAVGVAFRPSDGSPLVAITCGGIVDILPAETCRSKVGPRLAGLVAKLRDQLSGGSNPSPGSAP